MRDEPLKKVQSLIQEFKARHLADVANAFQISQKLIAACNKVADSWSGSFAGYHARLYYRNFEAPTIDDQFSVEWGGIHGIPDGWEKKTTDEVKATLEQLTGSAISFDELKESIRKFLVASDELRTEIVIQLSSLALEGSKEKELFDLIEKFQFGERQRDFIKRITPHQIVSRDSDAVYQGVCIPEHLRHAGLANEAQSTCNAIEAFLKLSDRLVRQLEIKGTMSLPKDRASNTYSLENLHPEIYEKCEELYAQEHFAEAVEKGFKVVRDRLRKLTGYETGSEAFGKGRLHIKGAAAPNVDKDFNEAVKFLTMAIDNFRNEKAHTSDAKIDNPTRAYEYLRLSSLAMNLLDNAEVKNEKNAN